jgi:hypothetical protein
MAATTEGHDMAGSGHGGWISGPSWYDRHKERKAKFLVDHPDWSIVYIRSLDIHKASSGDTDSGLDILQDKYLGALMDRLEARFAPPEEAEAEGA